MAPRVFVSGRRTRKAVSVVGEFNDWDAERDPLKREDNGLWFCEVKGAKAGQQYQFELTNGDQRLRKNDAYARMIHPEKATSVIYADTFKWNAPAFVLPKWNEMVLYEMHVGTFGKKLGGKGGSGGFDEVIARLPYLKSLGVNALEIMPLMAFPSEHSWGYSLTNPFAVEPSYGGPDALKRLVDVAHALGIALIIDIVINHFGPDNLDLWQYDGWSENGKGGIYFYNDQRAWTPWGENRPDFGRGEVRQYLRDSALLWLEEFRFDGLRVDATLFIRNTRGEEGRPEADLPEGWTLMQWINDEVERFFPGRWLVAEDLQRNEWITKPTQRRGSRLSRAVGPVVRPPDPAQRGDVRRRGAVDGRGGAGDRVHLQRRSSAADHLQRVARPGRQRPGARAAGDRPERHGGLLRPEAFHARRRPGHDQSRCSDAVRGPGIPRDRLVPRRCLPRLDQAQDPSRHQPPVSRSRPSPAQPLRRHARGLTGRSVHLHHFNNQDKVIGFHRWDQGGARDDVVVVASFSNREIETDYRIGFPRGGRWIIRFNSDWKGYSPDFHEVGNPGGAVEAEREDRDGFPFSATVRLPSYGLLIFSQDEAGPSAEQLAEEA